MLARRPMLCFALALMAGVIATRFLPWVATCRGYGWALFAVLAVWFALNPAAKSGPQFESPPLEPAPLDPPSAFESMPAAYRTHIVPEPGFLPRRGLNRFILVACLAAFLLGSLRQNVWERQLDPRQIPAEPWFEARLLATEPARIHSGEAGRWSSSARILEVNGKPFPGETPVRLFGPDGPDFRRGDLIVGRMRKDRPGVLAHPGAFDYQALLERNGLVGSLSLVQRRTAETAASETDFTEGGDAAAGIAPPAVYRVEPVATPSLAIRLLRCTDAVRARAIALTLRYGGSSGPVLAAMLYGYRKDMDRELQGAFRRVGIGHVLAISGLHVGLVVGLLWWLGGWVRWSLRARALACLVLALFYLGLTGMQVAATRATLMAAIHLGGIACGRKSDMLNSLGAAAFLITAVNPQSPLDVSFQLSFTAVVFIFAAMHRLPDTPSARLGDGRPDSFARSRSDRPYWLRELGMEAESLARLSVATWLGLLPIIAVVFNQVNPMGLPINMLVIPGMAAVLAGGLLLPWFGWLPGAGWLLTAPCRALEALAWWSDGIHYSSFPVQAPGPFWVTVFYLFAGMYLVRGMIDRRKRRGWTLAAVGGGIIGLAAMGVEMQAASPPPPTGRVAVLPGAGMGTLVAEAPDGSMAVLGEVRRGGIGEAGWLHYLRRTGSIGLVALDETRDWPARNDLARNVAQMGDGGPANQLAADLAYHYPLSSAVLIPGAAGRPGETVLWRAVEKAEGVRYAYGRDAEGKVAWLAVRAGSASAALARGAGWEDLAKALARGDEARGAGPGWVDLLSLRTPGRSPGRKRLAEGLPFRRVAVSGFGGSNFPSGWFDRGRYGVLTETDGLKVFDGAKWVRLDYIVK